MTNPVYIIEAKIIDHPDYECFVDVYESFDEAVEYCKKQIQEELYDLDDEGEVEVKPISHDQSTITSKEALNVFYITTKYPQ